jgi:hypothetical protein
MTFALEPAMEKVGIFILHLLPSFLEQGNRTAMDLALNRFISTTAQRHNCQNMQKVLPKRHQGLPVAATDEPIVFQAELVANGE